LGEARESGRLIVSTLTLANFRSYETLDLSLRPGLVLAWGPNGAGKTNLLESIHVATQGVSPRTRNDANLARFGAAGFDVGVTGVSDRGAVAIDLRWRVGEGKQVRVNGTGVASLERLRVDNATLVFTPDRLAVVKAGPSVRRLYIDRVIGRLFPARASLPSRYAEVLGQRNAALRRVATRQAPPDVVDPWSEHLLDAGTDLRSARAAIVTALAAPFTARGEELGLEAARLEYEPSTLNAEVLEARLGRDVERGSTGAGPHLDEIRLLAGTRELRSHGSQGEQRVAVLALLLAEGELLADARRTPPLLLLDDVLSELDGGRRAALVERLHDRGQVLVTAAARGALPGEADQVLEVSPGQVKEV
jgi:DNA replication and repair protein RecF